MVTTTGTRVAVVAAGDSGPARAGGGAAGAGCLAPHDTTLAARSVPAKGQLPTPLGSQSIDPSLTAFFGNIHLQSTL